MKFIYTLTLCFCVTASSLFAVSTQDFYATKWQQVDNALHNDYPSTALSLINSIRHRATAEKNMPQLCRALFQGMQCQTAIIPDSLESCIKVIREAMEAENNPAQQAIYAYLLGASVHDSTLIQKSMSDLILLADSRAEDYLPLIDITKESSVIFNNDLLHIFIGRFPDECVKNILPRAILLYQERGMLAAAYSLMLMQNKTEAELYPILRQAVDTHVELQKVSSIMAYLAEVEQPRVTVECTQSGVLIPGNLAEFVATARNIDEATLTVGRQQANFNFPKLQPWEERHDTIHIRLDSPGIYDATILWGGIKNSTKVHVSSVKPLIFGQPDERCRIILVDSRTGAPLPSTRIVERDNHGRVVKTFTPADDGFIYMKQSDWQKPYNQRYQFYPEAGKDTFHPAIDRWNFHTGYFRASDDSQNHYLQIYTDRNIYRPGQKVQFGILAYTNHNDEYKVEAGDTLTLRCTDSYNTTLYETKVTTDEFGSASESFTLPKICQPGYFYIYLYGEKKWQQATHSISVEEYKRPTFEIKTDHFSEPFSPGDTVLISGSVRTYTDIALANTKIIASTGDTLTTNAEGRFSFTMVAERQHRWYWMGQSVSISATASNGETVSTTIHIPLRWKNQEEEKEISKYEKPFWYEEKTNEDHTEATLTIGTSILGEKKPTVRYAFLDIASKKNIIEHKIVEFTDSFSYTFSYREEWGDGATLTLAFVRDGQLYSASTSVTRAIPNKKLNLKWSTFRSLLQPGEEEEWTVQITHPDGTPANALAMARLYDATLDALRDSRWYFDLSFHRSIPSIYWNAPEWRCDGISLSQEMPQYPSQGFSTWKPGLLHYYGRYTKNKFYRTGMAPLASASGTKIREDLKMAKEESAEAMDCCVEENGKPALNKNSAREANKTEAVRKNLDETAFFYPSLRTDASGNVKISFRLPESLTQWHFTLFAHDKNMNFGLLNDTIVARRQLMAEIAAPRFLREGDCTQIPVTISNISDSAQACTLDFWMDQVHVRQQILLAAGARETLSFDYTAGKGEARFKAMLASEDYSDGEERVIPILADRVVITHSVPYSLSTAGSREIDLTPLWRELPTGTSATLTLEQTSNPAWHVVESLKPLLEEHAGSTTGWALQLYAARMTQYLKTRINEPTDSLLNPFELESQAINALNELHKLQKCSGGWTWYEGMKESPWITTTICTTLARLHLLTGAANESEKEMLAKALKYLHREMDRNVAEMKAYERKYKTTLDLANSHYEYLYLCAISQQPETGTTSYLLKKAEQDKHRLSIYGKAGAAVVLAYYNNKKLAAQHLRSLLEYSVSTDEMGRYFDTNRAFGWRNYKIPTQTFAIEALEALQPEKHDEIGELKLWLLQSRRTEDWKMPSQSTADAAYAILKGQEGVLTESMTSAGFTRETFDDAAHIGMKSLTVENHEQHPLWGAAFAQYEVPLADIMPSSSGITLTRTIEMPKTPHVGDRISIHYIIRADRDMDYVRVEAARAACMEPVEPLSGYDWRSGCYRSVYDDRNEYFFEHLAKGKHEFIEEIRLDRAGHFVVGMAQAECTYAPEFRCGSSSEVIEVQPLEVK